MVVLVWVLVVVSLMYFWLAGHWFARVLMFLMFALALGLGCGQWVASATGSTTPGPVILGMCVGAALAWPVASLPIYYRRNRARMTH